MRRVINLALTIAAPLCLTLALTANNAVAQEMQHVSFKISAANSKYTQQLNIKVGDAPNHILRIFEDHRTFPTNPPIIDGLKLVDEWDRGESDILNGSGTAFTQYGEYVMENGDKFFDHHSAVIETVNGKLTAAVIGYITGGTGKLKGIRGTVRSSAVFDVAAGINESSFNIDYSVPK